jgi:hypothetical protein
MNLIVRAFGKNPMLLQCGGYESCAWKAGLSATANATDQSFVYLKSLTLNFFMALIFSGSTACALCGKTLQQGEEITSLSPISDKQHPLYQYFNAGLVKQRFKELG